MNIFLKGIVFMAAIFCIQNVEAGFSNNGKMQSRNLNLSIGGTLDNNGELIGTETANISCETFTGKGSLSSPQITIKTKFFAYTGKIDCKGKCEIICSTPFNENMFTRTGGGEFIIIIDEIQHKMKPKSMNSNVSETEIIDELLIEVK